MHRTDSFRLSHITSSEEKSNNNNNNINNKNLFEEKTKNDTNEIEIQQQQAQQQKLQLQQQAQQQLLQQAQAQTQQQTQNNNVPKVVSHKSTNNFNFFYKKDEPTSTTTSNPSASSLNSTQQQFNETDTKQTNLSQAQVQEQEQGLRLVSLPSLTPPKPLNEPEFREKEKLDGYQSNILKKNMTGNNSNNHQFLSVQVEDSMDEPISYPPTSTYPNQMDGELPSKSPGRNFSGTGVTFGPNITVPVSNNNSSGSNNNNNNSNISNTSNSSGILTPGTPASAKKILKKTNSGPMDLPSPQHQQQQQQQATTPKRHSMPTWLSPNTSIDLGNSTSPLNRSKDTAALRHVQEKLEEVTLQKDATEKYLRLEIESLKK